MSKKYTIRDADTGTEIVRDIALSEVFIQWDDTDEYRGTELVDADGTVVISDIYAAIKK